MKAMILKEIVNLNDKRQPLELTELAVPNPKERELLVKVDVCGVCHTELDEIEGRIPPNYLPMVLGHQVVGRVEQTGSQVNQFRIGDRVGIAWIFSACGKCKFCKNGIENLCHDFRATGRDAFGGYAEYLTVSEEYAHAIPTSFSDTEAAPLLCAGAIGYRSLMLTGIKDGHNLGLTGFGASGHLVLKMVRYLYPKTRVFVFARSIEEREFALELGAVWAGDTVEILSEGLDSIIDTTPVWKPVVEALKNLDAGGRLVVNAIRKEELDKEYLLNLDYPTHLWLEKEIKSVANVTRADVREFLKIAAEIPIKPDVEEFDLIEVNRALVELKERKIRGAKVLRIT
jgi:propanol-preferring alcohol dehydrogenase